MIWKVVHQVSVQFVRLSQSLRLCYLLLSLDVLWSLHVRIYIFGHTNTRLSRRWRYISAFPMLVALLLWIVDQSAATSCCWLHLKCLLKRYGLLLSCSIWSHSKVGLTWQDRCRWHPWWSKQVSCRCHRLWLHLSPIWFGRSRSCNDVFEVFKSTGCCWPCLL